MTIPQSLVEVQIGEEKLQVVTPTYVKEYLLSSFYRSARENQVYRNNIKTANCWLCGVNQTKLNMEQLDWVKRNMCAGCDTTIPYFKQRVNEVLGFDDCSLHWTIDLKYDIKEPENEYSIEGSILHQLDNALADTLSSSTKLYKELESVFPDRGKVREIIQGTVEELLKKIVSDDTLTESVLSKLKATTISDMVDLATIRMWNEILNEGEYRKIATKRWYEEKVVGFYSNHGVNIFLIGHIDKIFKLSDGAFCIRDKKTTRRVRLWGIKDGGYFGAELQLGGYRYLLMQYYGAQVQTLGEIELSRYLDVIPVRCDDQGFIKVLEKLTTHIREGRAPFKGLPPLCGPKYCGYWTLNLPYFQGGSPSG